MLRSPAGTGIRQWFRPPKHLLVLFLATTVCFWAGLGWLGWQTLQQDEDLEKVYLQRQLDGYTETIAAEIRRTIGDFETQLDQLSVLPSAALPDALQSFAARLGADAVLVKFESLAMQAFPRNRLLYYPVVSSADQPFMAPLLPSRAYAQLSSNALASVELFESLAQSADPRVRAEALLGLARAQRDLGRFDDALASYARVQDPDVLVDGRPAELWAQVGRAELFAGQGRTAELRDEARRLQADLRAGRWQLTRATYLHHARQVRDWLGAEAGSPDRAAEAAMALTDEVADLWAQWQQDRASAEMAAGRVSAARHNVPVLVLWRATSERCVALVAGRAFLEDRILGSVRGLLERQGIQIVLEDREGREVMRHGTDNASRADMLRVTKTIQEMQPLPWALRTWSADLAPDRERFDTRRHLVITGLVFLALFVVTGSYLTMRAVNREVEAAQLKSDFVAAVSHEFRTPLTLLRQFSDLLADGRVSSDQERRLYYAALQRGTRRLTRLVEDLLDFGRMEAGSRAFTRQPIAAREWFHDLVSEFREEVRSRGYTVELTWECPAALVIDIEREAVGRAVWNLLDNAVKYSPTHRTVWVAGRCADGQLTLSVRDRGLGVSTEEQRAIFRKFVRGSGAGGHGIRGTGLGLALVEQIVEAHGGKVHLESVVGEGSTFAIVLPARVEEHVQAETAWRAS